MTITTANEATAILATANEKTFTFGGVSDLNGIYKARFANDAGRVKVLDKNGHIDIRLVALPTAFTKAQTVAFLKEHDDFQDEMAQLAFSDFETVKVPGTRAKASKGTNATGLQLFTFAGVSDLNGEYKARFANDAMRVKVLDKNGHRDIRLVPLPNAMTKREAVEYIMALDEFDDIEAQRAFDDLLSTTVKQVKTEVAVVETEVVADNTEELDEFADQEDDDVANELALAFAELAD
jgi:hypothetical protein